jgi:hypothetical protein
VSGASAANSGRCRGAAEWFSEPFLRVDEPGLGALRTRAIAVISRRAVIRMRTVWQEDYLGAFLPSASTTMMLPFGFSIFNR